MIDVRKINELVQRMIDNEGIYLCSGKDGASPFVIWSTRGTLTALEKGLILDPERFLDNLEVRGPLHPNQPAISSALAAQGMPVEPTPLELTVSIDGSEPAKIYLYQKEYVDALSAHAVSLQAKINAAGQTPCTLDGDQKIGHDEAQQRIEQCVREIEILCDQFGYDRNEWLYPDDDDGPVPAAPNATAQATVRAEDSVKLPAEPSGPAAAAPFDWKQKAGLDELLEAYVDSLDGGDNSQPVAYRALRDHYDSILSQLAAKEEEIAGLREERSELRELLSTKFAIQFQVKDVCTIVDFLRLWHEQERDARHKAETESAELRAKVEAQAVIGELIEIQDGDDTQPNTIFCAWNEKRGALPAGTKIYAALRDKEGTQ